MISVSAPADSAGIEVLCAAVRSAVALNGSDGDSAALALRQGAFGAQQRLRGGEEQATLEASVDIRGTELVVTLRDSGEPVGSPPEGVLALLGAGLLTAADVRTDGRSNISEVRLPLPSHHTVLDAGDLQVVPEDAAPSTDDVQLRQLRADDAAALTRAIYRTYGWSYPNHSLYYPDRIAAAIASGQRVGEVAIAPDGEIAAHWGAVMVSPGVAETGTTVTDPRFRRRGLAGQLGVRLLERLTTDGVRARLREPVLTHPATQHIALSEGATMVGAYLNYTMPYQQVGITDGVMAQRGSLCIAFSALTPLQPADLWVPKPYESFVSSILTTASWPRTLRTATPTAEAPSTSSITTEFDADNKLAIADVHLVGRDLVDAISATLDDMRRTGAEFIAIRLPACQPATATHGAGLTELGVSFAAYLPEFRPPTAEDRGDVVVAQWLADPVVDPSDWSFTTPEVEQLVTAIVEQAAEVGTRTGRRQRRAAQRASLLAALD